MTRIRRHMVMTGRITMLTQTIPTNIISIMGMVMVMNPTLRAEIFSFHWVEHLAVVYKLFKTYGKKYLERQAERLIGNGDLSHQCYQLLIC